MTPIARSSWLIGGSSARHGLVARLSAGEAVDRVLQVNGLVGHSGLPPTSGADRRSGRACRGRPPASDAQLRRALQHIGEQLISRFQARHRLQTRLDRRICRRAASRVSTMWPSRNRRSESATGSFMSSPSTNTRVQGRDRPLRAVARSRSRRRGSNANNDGVAARAGGSPTASAPPRAGPSRSA